MLDAEEASTDSDDSEGARDEKQDRPEEVRTPYMLILLFRREVLSELSEGADVEEQGPGERGGRRQPVLIVWKPSPQRDGRGLVLLSFVHAGHRWALCLHQLPERRPREEEGSDKAGESVSRAPDCIGIPRHRSHHKTRGADDEKPGNRRVQASRSSDHCPRPNGGMTNIAWPRATGGSPVPDDYQCGGAVSPSASGSRP